MSATSNPEAAKQHARSMAGTQVETMPAVPPWSDQCLPKDIDPSTLLWRETIAAGGYTSKILDRGARLSLEDLKGDACVSMLLFNSDAPYERLNVADTLKVQWSAYLGAGSLLLSDMGRVLMTILESDAPSPDAFCGPSSLTSNSRRYGDGSNHGTHPNARDRFKLAVAKHGLGAVDIHPCLNWFKEVQIDAVGNIKVNVGPFAPSRMITLRAEMNLIVVLANCPHILDTREEYQVSAVRVTSWRGPIADADDPHRNATIEAQRAFLNVDDYYRR